MSIGILYSLLLVAIGYSVSRCLPLRYQIATESGYRQYGAILLYGTVYTTGCGFILFLITAVIWVPYKFVFGGEIGYSVTLLNLYDFVMEHATSALSMAAISSLLFSHFVNKYYGDSGKKEYIAREANIKQGNALNIILIDSVDKVITVLFA